jgi:hypothetical protein
VQVDEYQAAGVPQEHDPASNADGRPVVGRLLDLLAVGPDLGDRPAAVEPVAVITVETPALLAAA